MPYTIEELAAEFAPDLWTTEPCGADGSVNLLYDGVVVASIYGCIEDDLKFIVAACNQAEWAADNPEREAGYHAREETRGA